MQKNGDALRYPVWNDWLASDNPYAVGDRKTMEAGGWKYMNFIAIILRRK